MHRRCSTGDSAHTHKHKYTNTSREAEREEEGKEEAKEERESAVTRNTIETRKEKKRALTMMMTLAGTEYL
jgi:hypothetical protein